MHDDKNPKFQENLNIVENSSMARSEKRRFCYTWAASSIAPPFLAIPDVRPWG